MTGQLYNHIGIVVPDIEVARERFSEVLQLDFTRVVDLSIDAHVRGKPVGAIDLRAAYSIAGPPHYELIEQTGNDIYGPDEIGRIHHVGYLYSDIAGRTEELDRLGLRLDMLRYGPAHGDPLYTVYTEPAGLFGVRVEYSYSERPTFVEAYGPEGSSR